MAKSIVTTTANMLPKITDLTATVTAGGELEANKTYYYQIFVSSNRYIYNLNQYDTFWANGLSNEVAVTTTDGNQTVELSRTLPDDGNTYYIGIYRTDEQGNYNIPTSYRLGGGAAYINYESTSFTDDGTTYKTVYKYSLQGLDFNTRPGHLNPRDKGTITIILEGGTEDDPITEQDIYDLMVADGSGDYVYWDGNILEINANFRLSSNETHIKFSRSFVVVYGGYQGRGAYNELSTVKMGLLSSYKYPYGGIRFMSIGNAYSKINLGKYERTYMYDSKILGFWTGGDARRKQNYITYIGSQLSTYGYLNTNVFSPNGIGLSIYGAILDGCVINSGTSYVRPNSDCYYLSDSSGTYAYVGYASLKRGDELHLDYPTYQVFMPRFNSTFRSTTLIDLVSRYKRNGLPIVRRYNIIESEGRYVDNYYSLQIKSEQGGTLNIKDVNGNYGVDYTGAEIKDIEADEFGNFWLDNIAITYVGADYIIDDSKSREDDERKAKNVMLINSGGALTKMKVLSNTSNTLYFTKEIPSGGVHTGDTAGIIIDLFIARQTADGDGSHYNSVVDDKRPHTITISKEGFLDSVINTTITDKFTSNVTLTIAKDFMIDVEGNINLLLDKTKGTDSLLLKA